MATRQRNPKQPADRQRKLPRRVVVGIYLDDSLADVHDGAVAELERTRERCEASRLRRVAAGKARNDELAARGFAVEGTAADVVDEAIAAELAPLQAKVDEALAALDAGTDWYTFRSIGRAKFRDLIADYPPEEEDHVELRQQTGNPEAEASYSYAGVAPALIAAACISHPELVDEVAVCDLIFDNEAWNAAEISALFTAALSANTQGRAVTHRRPPVPVALAS